MASKQRKSVQKKARRKVQRGVVHILATFNNCLLYTSPSPRDATLSRMPSSA